MKYLRLEWLLALLVLTVMLFGPELSLAQEVVGANIRGGEEVAAISTTGNGLFRGTISSDESSISYTLIYFNLEGAVRESHIHFAQPGVNGGISAFLCTNLGNGPPGTPLCPASGSVSGTITASEVTDGAASQGISAGEISELIGAMRRGETYANVHSDLHVTGEIRGQIR